MHSGEGERKQQKQHADANMVSIFIFTVKHIGNTVH